jgi:hypothetical protein
MKKVFFNSFQKDAFAVNRKEKERKITKSKGDYTRVLEQHAGAVPV